MPGRFTDRRAVAVHIESMGGLTRAIEDGITADAMPDRELAEAWLAAMITHDVYGQHAAAIDEMLPWGDRAADD